MPNLHVIERGMLMGTQPKVLTIAARLVRGG